MQGSAPLHNFAARCPRGHRPSQSRTLDELRDPQLRFYCRLCECSFQPETADRLRALTFAEASEASWQQPMPAA